VLKNITQEFSNTTVYGNTVIAIELLNEPRISSGHWDINTLKTFYSDAANAVWGNDGSTKMNITIHGM
jgi:aryl-phospho-beta-D-glucosidase BglC (GH1 family)